MAETTTRTGLFTGLSDFVREVIEQLKKVTWPDKAQLQNSTGVILVFMFLVAAVIFVMDLGVRTVLDVVTSLFTK
jgi:preprotein translocase subunit SecE